MTDTPSFPIQLLPDTDEVSPPPPRDSAALELNLRLDQPISAARDYEAPIIVINGTQVPCGYGRWFIPVTPGEVEVSVSVNEGIAASVAVVAPQRKIRRLNIWIRPEDDQIPIAVHCPYPPTAEPWFSLTRGIIIFLLVILLINVVAWIK